MRHILLSVIILWCPILPMIARATSYMLYTSSGWCAALLLEYCYGTPFYRIWEKHTKANVMLLIHVSIDITLVSLLAYA